MFEYIMHLMKHLFWWFNLVHSSHVVLSSADFVASLSCWRALKSCIVAWPLSLLLTNLTQAVSLPCADSVLSLPCKHSWLCWTLWTVSLALSLIVCLLSHSFHCSVDYQIDDDLSLSLVFFGAVSPFKGVHHWSSCCGRQWIVVSDWTHVSIFEVRNYCAVKWKNRRYSCLKWEIAQYGNTYTCTCSVHVKHVKHVENIAMFAVN